MMSDELQIIFSLIIDHSPFNILSSFIAHHSSFITVL